MAFNLNRFKGEMAFEGARPTLFEAILSFPGTTITGKALSDFTFHCKSAQLPGKTLGIIELPYYGRKIKVHGDQTFAEWTVTIMNEETFNVRNTFENWMSQINTTQSNLQFLNSKQYKCDAKVFQYNKSGRKIKEYNFNGMWPSDISAIDVSWETNDAIEEFTVTLQYDWWTSAQAISSVI